MLCAMKNRGESVADVRRSIGQLAEAAGVNIETVRYYHRRGLIPLPPKRVEMAAQRCEFCAWDRSHRFQHLIYNIVAHAEARWGAGLCTLGRGGSDRRSASPLAAASEL